MTLVSILLLELLNEVKHSFFGKLQFCLEQDLRLRVLNCVVLDVQHMLTVDSDKLEDKMVGEYCLINDSLVCHLYIKDSLLFIIFHLLFWLFGLLNLCLRISNLLLLLTSNVSHLRSTLILKTNNFVLERELKLCSRL